MLRQRDGDGNLVLILSPRETVQLHQTVGAAAVATGYGLTNYDYQELRNTMGLLSTTLFAFSDEEIIEAWIAPHLEHEHDDLDGMRRDVAEALAEARPEAEERGLIPVG